ARQANLGQEVQMLKHQVELYRVQHLDKVPDLVSSWDPLVKPSDIQGNVHNPAGQTYGPYLPTAPTNPLTNSNVVATSAAPTVGWVYNAQTGEVHGVDASGNKTDDGVTVLP
ncbi:MAG TPA: hypothetical protein VFD32_10680, partial [Dehalococcoidia bacterium]|nr:hypothetical protein [Dehalococcoidia bacterium]